MDNITTLFENLMTYNEVNETPKRNIKPIKENKKIVKEDDSTILNLSVEIPTDKEDITPEDIDVNVGVMNLEDDNEPDNEDKDSTEENDVDEISIKDDSEESEESNDESDKEEKEDEEKDEDKKESLKRRRLEAYKKYKEAKSCNKTECDSIEKESKDVETAKQNIINRVKNKTESKEVKCTGKEDCECEACKSKKQIKKESISRLDTGSLNRLITTFVKDNYKNIDKIVISKAVLENKKLTLQGKIKDLKGKTEDFSLVNRGFDTKKLEGKRFEFDFIDGNNTFNVMKESLKKPFIFTASLKNGVLKFESLKYDFKTKVTEGKIANVSGSCSVLKESKTYKYNRSTFLKEAALKPMNGADLLDYQGANNFADGTQPYIAEGKGGTLIVAGSDENDGSALISIYYGPDGDQWAWKSYNDKETALKDAKLLVNIVDDEEVDVNQLKRFGFELM